MAGGEIVALVGESGCGKSSLARTVAGIQQPISGQVILDGVTLAGQRRPDLKRYRRAIQLIHQDPYDALDPRQTVRSIVLEGLPFTDTRDPNATNECAWRWNAWG